MDDRNLNRLLDNEREWREYLIEQFEKIDGRVSKLELSGAEQRGQFGVVKRAGVWFNGIIFLLFGAYVEWRFNRLN